MYGRFCLFGRTQWVSKVACIKLASAELEKYVDVQYLFGYSTENHVYGEIILSYLITFTAMVFTKLESKIHFTWQNMFDLVANSSSEYSCSLYSITKLSSVLDFVLMNVRRCLFQPKLFFHQIHSGANLWWTYSILFIFLNKESYNGNGSLLI